MNLILTRTTYRRDGIFGAIVADETGAHICLSLEHSYLQADGTFAAKLPVGAYQCVRGPHRLHGMQSDFETFEISGVVGHSNILFHWGNFNKDSEGCVLVGEHLIKQADGTEMIDNSRYTFAKFMALQAGVNVFTLTVK